MDRNILKGDQTIRGGSMTLK